MLVPRRNVVRHFCKELFCRVGNDAVQAVESNHVI
jgi:hypothetical protein